jgi:glycosyltransferase involved in cell wall biosynthesis
LSLKVLVISDYRDTVSVRPEAELFIGLARKGVEVTIMTYSEAVYVEKFKAAGIKVIDFHPRYKADKKEIAFIKEELKTGGHHVMHLFNGKAIVTGLQAAKGVKVKVVLYRGYTGNIHWYDPTAYFKYLSPRVDKIFCISDATRDLIKRNRIFGKDKPVTINKGHDLEWYDGIEPADLSELNLPSDAFIVTNVCNARPMKGIPYLIKSTYELPVDLPIHYLLVGNNLNTPEHQKLVAASPNKDKFHFLGFRKDVLNVVKASDAFVLSSLYGEATTKAVIEAMSLGICPLITDIPGNRGLVIDKECGLVFPSKDPKAIAEAILEVYRNPEKRKEYAANARLQIDTKFNIKDTIENTRNLYESLKEQL